MHFIALRCNGTTRFKEHLDSEHIQNKTKRIEFNSNSASKNGLS